MRGIEREREMWRSPGRADQACRHVKKITEVNPFGGCGAGLDLGTNSTRSQSEIDWFSDGYESGHVPRFGEKISTRPFGGVPGREMPRKLQDVAPVREVVALVRTGTALGMYRHDGCTKVGAMIVDDR
jgi:hypothetical protein